MSSSLLAMSLSLLVKFSEETNKQIKRLEVERGNASMGFDFSANLREIWRLKQQAEDIENALKQLHKEDEKKHSTLASSINREVSSFGLNAQDMEHFRGVVSEQIDEKRAILLSIESSLEAKQLLVERTVSEIDKLRDDLGLEATNLHNLEQTLKSIT